MHPHIFKFFIHFAAMSKFRERDRLYLKFIMSVSSLLQDNPLLDSKELKKCKLLFGLEEIVPRVEVLMPSRIWKFVESETT